MSSVALQEGFLKYLNKTILMILSASSALEAQKC